MAEIVTSITLDDSGYQAGAKRDRRRDANKNIVTPTPPSASRCGSCMRPLSWVAGSNPYSDAYAFA